MSIRKINDGKFSRICASVSGPRISMSDSIKNTFLGHRDDVGEAAVSRPSVDSYRFDVLGDFVALQV